MERLTERELYDGKVCYTKCSKTNCKDKCCDCPVEQEIPVRLKQYEDAEEQGLLLRLPCPIGTKVYALVNECEEMYEPSSWYTTISEEKFDFYMIDVFGKEVFLTREEAESALAEKGGA